MRGYKAKRFCTVGGNYINVRVYKNLTTLRAAYSRACNDRGIKDFAKDILGVHCAYKKVRRKPEEPNIDYLLNDTGTVYLSATHLQPHIVAHEFLHALLWSHKHEYIKEQHPICILNMEEEEDICYGLTDLLQRFYKWKRQTNFK